MLLITFNPAKIPTIDIKLGVDEADFSVPDEKSIKEMMLGASLENIEEIHSSYQLRTYTHFDLHLSFEGKFYQKDLDSILDFFSNFVAKVRRLDVEFDIEEQLDSIQDDDNNDGEPSEELAINSLLAPEESSDYDEEYYSEDEENFIEKLNQFSKRLVALESFSQVESYSFIYGESQGYFTVLQENAIYAILQTWIALKKDNLKELELNIKDYKFLGLSSKNTDEGRNVTDKTEIETLLVNALASCKALENVNISSNHLDAQIWLNLPTILPEKLRSLTIKSNGILTYGTNFLENIFLNFKKLVQANIQLGSTVLLTGDREVIGRQFKYLCNAIAHSSLKELILNIDYSDFNSIEANSAKSGQPSLNDYFCVCLTELQESISKNKKKVDYHITICKIPFYFSYPVKSYNELMGKLKSIHRQINTLPSRSSSHTKDVLDDCSITTIYPADNPNALMALSVFETNKRSRSPEHEKSEDETKNKYLKP